MSSLTPCPTEGCELYIQHGGPCWGSKAGWLVNQPSKRELTATSPSPDAGEAEAPRCLIHGKRECVCLGARFWMDRALVAEGALAESKRARDALKGMLDSQAAGVLRLLVEKRTLIEQLDALKPDDEAADLEQHGCRECGSAFVPMGEEDICRACDHARGDFEP